MGVVLGLGGAELRRRHAHVSVCTRNRDRVPCLGYSRWATSRDSPRDGAGSVAGHARVRGPRATRPAFEVCPRPDRGLALHSSSSSGLPTLIMAALYWCSPRSLQTVPYTSIRQIANVDRSSKLVWIVTYLNCTDSARTLFAASTPTYLADRWGVHAAKAGMVYTSMLVVCVAATRPVRRLAVGSSRPTQAAVRALQWSARLFPPA